MPRILAPLQAAFDRRYWRLELFFFHFFPINFSRLLANGSGNTFYTPQFHNIARLVMARHGAVTFKGNPLTLVGEPVKVGAAAPDFTLHYFEGGLKTIKLADLKGKPTLLSVVPSLDTGVCAIQTKKFNEQLAALGDRINAVTVSLDLPFAMNRFCGAESIKNMRVGSDYQDRTFGKNYGMLIDELKILARGVFVLDKDGKVVYAQQVKEVAEEPDYSSALAAIKSQL
jgi:thioredoxin-dependent peroxiredoxin